MLSGIISGLLSALLFGGVSYFARVILKNKQTFVESGTFKILRIILFIWALCAIPTVFFLIYSIMIWDTQSLKEGIPIVLILTICMVAIFIWFRKIVEKQEEKEASASQNKFAQQAKAASIAELEILFSEFKEKSSKVKYTIANQIEKNILSMTSDRAEQVKLQFNSKSQKEFIQDQIIDTCLCLSKNTLQSDSALLISIINRIIQDRSEAKVISQEKSSVSVSCEIPPPARIAAIQDPSNSDFCYCPKCNTRQRSNRSRCMECGEYFIIS